MTSAARTKTRSSDFSIHAMIRPNTKKRVGYLLLAIALCVIFYVAHRADQANRILAANVSGPDLVGTWRADNGVLFQLRADGTGRSRSQNATLSDVHYFEWTADSSSLSIIYAPRGRLKGLIARSLGVEIAQFKLEQASLDTFTLVNGPPLSKTRFERTEDETLDNAL